VQVKYSQEISEDLRPTPGKVYPVVVPTEYSKVNKRRVNTVFYYLAGSSVLCLGAVAIEPNPIVQGTAIAIWTGSLALGRFLLAGAYRGKTQHH
jgi:hypothetical protein